LWISLQWSAPIKRSAIKQVFKPGGGKGLPKKTHKREEIFAKLRQVDLLVSHGQSLAEMASSIGVVQFANDE
jgi:hypothetical protein